MWLLVDCFYVHLHCNVIRVEMRLRHTYMRMHLFIAQYAECGLIIFRLRYFLNDINMRICAYVHMCMNLAPRWGFDFRLFRVMEVRFCKVWSSAIDLNPWTSYLPTTNRGTDGDMIVHKYTNWRLPARDCWEGVKQILHFPLTRGTSSIIFKGYFGCLCYQQELRVCEVMICSCLKFYNQSFVIHCLSQCNLSQISATIKCTYTNLNYDSRWQFFDAF